MGQATSATEPGPIVGSFAAHGPLAASSGLHEAIGSKHTESRIPHGKEVPPGACWIIAPSQLPLHHWDAGMEGSSHPCYPLSSSVGVVNLPQEPEGPRNAIPDSENTKLRATFRLSIVAVPILVAY